MAANKFRETPIEVSGVPVVNPKPLKDFINMMGIDINKPYSVRLEADKLVIILK